MSDEPKDQQKKIIIDEDWKARVEAEGGPEPRRRRTPGETGAARGRSAAPADPNGPGK